MDFEVMDFEVMDFEVMDFEVMDCDPARPDSHEVATGCSHGLKPASAHGFEATIKP